MDAVALDSADISILGLRLTDCQLGPQGRKLRINRYAPPSMTTRSLIDIALHPSSLIHRELGLWFEIVGRKSEQETHNLAHNQGQTMRDMG